MRLRIRGSDRVRRAVDDEHRAVHPVSQCAQVVGTKARAKVSVD